MKKGEKDWPNDIMTSEKTLIPARIVKHLDDKTNTSMAGLTL